MLTELNAPTRVTVENVENFVEFWNVSILTHSTIEFGGRLTVVQLCQMSARYFNSRWFEKEGIYENIFSEVHI